MKSVTYRVKIVSAVKIVSGRRPDVLKRPLYNRRGRRLDVPKRPLYNRRGRRLDVPKRPLYNHRGRRLDVAKRTLYNRRGRRLDVPLLFFLFIRFYFLSLDLIVFTPILC